MKLPHHPHLVARCVLALVALCAVGVQAGPPEDTAQAETLIRGGDFVNAMVLLRKAADQNHAPAQARLADLLLLGFEDQALGLYRKAADQGDPGGEFGLGRMHADGMGGLPSDPAKALEWYWKAERKNHAPAIDALARAYRHGSLGLPKDPDKARELDARARGLFQQAAGAAK